MAEIEGEEQAAAQQEGEDRVLPVAKTEDPCVVETSLEEVPETLVDEHEQVLPAYEDSEEEEDELSSLAQQPEVVEEAASDAGLMGCRVKEEEDGRADVPEVAQHCFNFPSSESANFPTRGSKRKRPKSPEREGVQLAEQHGSGGEGGEEMEIERPQFRFDMTKEQLDQYCNAMQQEYNDQYVSVLDSARRQQHFK